jgi:pimeloyl-ACP methyl ester carboxylesterase
MRRHWRRIVLVALVVLAVVLAVGFVWLNDLADPTPEASAALAPDEAVTVTRDGAIVFQPAEPATTGFIFYPGGRVAAEAYAPQMRDIAEAGYLAVITPMPFGLAVLAPDAADAVIADHPEIDRWVIGGHSLGGAMAAQYAAENADRIDGLALWAAYPAEGTDLSGADIMAASISGSNDGLATPDEIQASAARLPADTTFVEIAGGNHAQFGWYGEQGGDGEATIAPAEQQDQTVAATLALLEAVSTAA